MTAFGTTRTNSTDSFAWITDDTDSGKYTVVVTADDGFAKSTEYLALKINESGNSIPIQRTFLVNAETEVMLLEVAPEGTYEFTQA
jgi:hypothetical protein